MMYLIAFSTTAALSTSRSSCRMSVRLKKGGVEGDVGGGGGTRSACMRIDALLVAAPSCTWEVTLRSEATIGVAIVCAGSMKAEQLPMAIATSWMFMTE